MLLGIIMICKSTNKPKFAYRKIHPSEKSGHTTYADKKNRTQLNIKKDHYRVCQEPEKRRASTTSEESEGQVMMVYSNCNLLVSHRHVTVLHPVIFLKQFQGKIFSHL